MLQSRQQQASVTTGAALEKTNWSKINEHFQSFCQQGITSVPLVVERKKMGISNIITDEPTEEAGYIICFHHCCHHCCINNSIEMHFSPISNRRFLTRPSRPFWAASTKRGAKSARFFQTRWHYNLRLGPNEVEERQRRRFLYSFCPQRNWIIPPRTIILQGWVSSVCLSANYF